MDRAFYRPQREASPPATDRLHIRAASATLSASPRGVHNQRRCMMKRSMILAAVLAVAWMMSGRQAAETIRAEDKADKPVVKKDKAAPYVHTVIFHLKEDAAKGAAEGLITDAHELLARIPTVRELRVGRPAEKGTPNRAKKDFAVALV